MDKFEEAELPPESFDSAALMVRFNVSRDVAESFVSYNRSQKVFMNDTYQVNVREAEVGDYWPESLHLSIKRRDKQPIHDWRELQTIKNEIVGPEHEAVELYPAESRLTDTANQYHLWVLKSHEHRFPFGFNDGHNVSTPEEAAKMGAVQRPFTRSPT